MSLRLKSPMSFATLYMCAKNIAMFMGQDAVYFATRGVSSADISALINLANAFSVVTLDYDAKLGLQEAVEMKLEARSAAFNQVKVVRGFALQGFGEDSAIYKQLKISRFSSAKDSDFISLASNLIRVCEDNMSSLSAVGLTQAKLDSLQSSLNLMQSKMDEAEDFKAQKKEKILEKREKANELYTFIKKYATIGKLLAEEYPEVSYNKYLIRRYYAQKRKKAITMPIEVPET